jgi:hypothetical protein
MQHEKKQFQSTKLEFQFAQKKQNNVITPLMVCFLKIRNFPESYMHTVHIMGIQHPWPSLASRSSFPVTSPPLKKTVNSNQDHYGVSLLK